MEVTSGPVSIRLEGASGWIASNGWAAPLQASDPALLHRKYDPATTKMWPRRPREQRDFLDCVKSGKPPMYTAEALHRLCTTLHLGGIAMELGRRITWDPSLESFGSDAEANALRARPTRETWKRA